MLDSETPLEDHPAASTASSERSPRGGGPKTLDGKAVSSQNATTHGCCSNKLILPDENEEDFERLRQSWLTNYEAHDDFAYSLITKALEADWFLQRGVRRYHQAEQSVFAEQPDPMQWNEEQHKKIERFTRYRTTAERSFGRAFKDVQHLHSSRKQEVEREQRKGERQAKFELQLLKAQSAMRAQQENPPKRAKPDARAEQPKEAEALFRGQNAKKLQRKIHLLEQWVEVRVQDGNVTTQLVPSNEDLIEKGKKMYPPPELVYRRINFPDGVPEIYYWTTDEPDVRRLGGCGIQRMTVETWLKTIKQEAERGDGHIGITEGGNLPRPKERGGCECPVCTTNQAILDRKAEAQAQRVEGGAGPSLPL